MSPFHLSPEATFGLSASASSAGATAAPSIAHCSYCIKSSLCLPPRLSPVERAQFTAIIEAPRVIKKKGFISC